MRKGKYLNNVRYIKIPQPQIPQFGGFSEIQQSYLGRDHIKLRIPINKCKRNVENRKSAL